MITMIRSVWLVIKTSVKVSPTQSAICLLETFGNVVNVLQPLFITWLVAGAIQRDRTSMIAAVIALILSRTVVMFLSIVGNNARVGQYERVGFWFDTEIARLTSSITTLDHLQEPDYLDKAQTLRDHQGLLGYSFNSVLNALRMLVEAVGTLALAMTADPRMLLVILAGVPAVLTTRWTTRWETEMDEASGDPSRRAKHLLELATTPGPGAENRVFGLQHWVREKSRTTARAWLDLRVVQARKSSVVEATSMVFFFAVAAVVLGWMLHDAIGGQLGVAAFVLGASLITRLQNITSMLQWSVRMLVRVGKDGGRFLWLRDYADRNAADQTGTTEPPARLSDGITLQGLGYTYPGRDKPTLEDVSLHLPAGAVVALVGENGAGKSTLVGLLTGMLRPSEGRILVDGVEMSELEPHQWRGRMSGAFQDYARLEFQAQESIGVGEVAQVASAPAAQVALEQASATDLLRALPAGLETQLGTTWPGGVDLSGGQWQRLAIARGMMRETPLLLVLDEPTAALDAGTEHALFERYAAAAGRAGGHGGVTLLVTHRFSTVASADLVIVLDRGRVAEVGTHAELHARGGAYAELYELQARGYR